MTKTLTLYRSLLILMFLAGQLFFVITPAKADPYPPYWQGGTGPAIHFDPVPWPDEPADPRECGFDCGDWVYYTRYDDSINDARDHDPSNGGTAPQNYVNIASSCIDTNWPSIYYHIDQANGVLMFRWRVEQIANTYATGPNAGAYSSSDPWNSALWTVFFDLDGDGYLDIAAHLDGSSGSPSMSIDRLVGIWSDVPNSQSLNYYDDPSIYDLAHNPTGFVDQSTNRILNFHTALSPDINWPNGSNETFWDYGTSRSIQVTKQNVDGATCDEYFVDYQIPLGLLDATAVGGPRIDQNTAFSMFFCTANSLNNPFQKDCAYQGDWIGDPNEEAPFGDHVSFDDGTINQPIVDGIQAEGCGPTTLTTSIRDTLVFESEPIPHTSVSDVDFYYYYDTNADGVANDGETWTLAASDAISTGLKTWEATWDSTGLLQGQYLLGVQAVDTASLNEPDESDGTRRANRTYSYLSQAEVDALPGNDPVTTGEHWFANPEVTGAVSVIANLNICGTPLPFITKSVTPDTVTAGDTVTFTLSISNTYDTPLAVNIITDTLPDGFSYIQTIGSDPSAATTPTGGATGEITWTLSSSIAATNTGILTFTAQATTIAGTYANLASADTDDGLKQAEPVQIGVGSPRLTLQKSANTFSANPGDTVTYTISYANDSPVNVTNAVITDVLPTGMNYVSALDGGTYNAGSRTLTWNVGDIPSGEGPLYARFVVTIENPYPDTAAVPLVNTAYINADQIDQTSAQSSIHVNVPRPALRIQKDAPVLVSPGAQVPFTLTYVNSGNYTATNVVITDIVPVSLTYVTANPLPTSTAGGEIVWDNIPNISAGGTGVIYLTLQVANPYPDSLDNPATNLATMEATGVSPISDTFDVGILQTGQVCNTYYFHDETADVGADGTQEIADTTAPIPADTGPVITITAPAGGPGRTVWAEALRFYQDPASDGDVNFSGNITTTIYVDRDPGNGLTVRGTVYDYDSTTGISVSLGSAQQTFGGSQTGAYTFAVNASGTLEKDHRLLWIFDVQVDHNSQTADVQLQYDGTVANYYSGGSTFADSNSYFCVTPPAKLVIDKQVNDLIAGPGDTLTYTIKFANIGQTNATGATITDTLPTGTTFVTSTLNGSPVAPASSSSPVYSFDINSSDVVTSGQVTGGETGELEIIVLVDLPLDSSVITLANDASIASDQTVAITDTMVTTILRPELTISKSANDTLLTAGDTVTYTLTVINSGYGTASNVTISDTLPATTYYTYVPGSTRVNGVAPGTDPVSGDLLRVNVGSMSSGQIVQVTFQMEVTSTLSAVPNGVTELGNTGTVSSTQTGEIDSSEVVTVSVSKNANLYVIKSFTPSGTRTPGDILTYTLTVENIGGLEAVNVRVADPIPDYTTYVAGTLAYSGTAQTDADDTDNGEYDVDNGRVIFDVGALPAEESRTMTFTVQIDDTMPNGTTSITNAATASAGNTAAKTSQTTTDVYAAPVLNVNKTGPATMASPAATLTANATNTTTLQIDDSSQLIVGQYIRIGAQDRQITAIDGLNITVDAPVTALSGDPVLDSLTYNVSYINQGDAAASNATIVDTLPTDTDFITATTPYVLSGNVITWTIGGLDPGESGEVKVTVFPTTTGTLTNTAQLDSDETGVDEDTVTTAVGGLRVRKRTTTSVVSQTLNGTSATYVIEVENTLPAAANDIVVTDTLASGFTYSETVSITGGTSPITNPTSGDAQPVWEVSAIAGNTTLAITFTVYISETVGPATYQNEVAVTSSDASVSPFDPLLTTDEDVEVRVPIVRLSKTVTPTTVQAGENVTYTITAENIGGATAQDVVITDTLPAGFSFVDTVSTDQDTANRTSIYTATTPAWGVWDIEPSGRVTIAFQAQTSAVTGTFTNTVSASASNTLIPTRDELAPVTTTAPTDADLSITKSESHDPVNAGTNLTYTLTILNNGPAGATGIVVTDTLPAGVTFVSATPDRNIGPNPLVWNSLTDLSSGNSTVITVVVTVNAATAGTIQNVATVTADEPDSTPGNDIITATTTITPQADLELDLSASDTTPNVGSTIVFTVVVTNTGPSDATGVDVSIPLPTGYTYVGDNSGGAYSGGLWTVGGLNDGNTATLVITATVNASGNYNVYAQVEDSDQYDDDSTPGDNSIGDDDDDTVNITPSAAVDLSVSKESQPNPAIPGDPITYTIVVTNAGPSALTAITLTDNLPAEIQNPNYFESEGSYDDGTGAWTSLTFGANETITLTIGGTLDPNFTGTLQNTATVTTGQAIDTDPNNNQSTDSNSTVPVIQATKRDALAIDADIDGVPSPGDTLSYTIIIANVGGSPVTGVTFSDTPDNNTTLVTGSVTTTAGSVTSGNGAGDTNVGVNIGNIQSGNKVTISFQIVISDPLPAGVMEVDNQGFVSSNELPVEPTDDPDTGPDDDETVTSVTAVPVLEAEKTDSLFDDADGDGVPSPGDTLLYEVSIINSGNIAATGIVFSDTLDSNTTLVTGTVQTDLGAVTSGNGAGDTSVAVNVGPLPGGGTSAVISYQVTIDNPLPAGVTQVTNQGLVSSNELPVEPTDDPDTGPEDDETVTPVTATPVLEAEKTDTLIIDADGDSVPSPGDTLLYNVSIVNSGDIAATGVVFSDTLDPNTTLVTGTVQTNRGSVTSGNGAGDTSAAVNVGTLPGGGASVDISYRVTINNPLPAGVTQVANQGLVSSSERPVEPTDDPNTPPDDDETVTPVTAAPVLEAAKTDILVIDADGDSVPSPGDTMLYQVSIVNSGNIAATGVVFSDTLDSNTTLVTGTVQTNRGAVTSGNGAGDTSVTVNIGPLPGGGASADISYRVTINSPLPAGVTQVANQGLVGSNELPVEPTDDPDTGPEDDETVTPVTAAPVLEAEKTDTLFNDADGDGVPSPGDTLLYQVSIVNSGNIAATSVILTDTLDPNTTLVTGTVQTNRGSVTSGNGAGDTSVSVDVGTLPGGGASADISYRVTINNPLPAGVMEVANQGLVSSNELPVEPTDDPNTPPDDDETVTPVTAAPVLEAAKTDILVIDADGDSVPSPGDTLLYQVRIVNSGNIAATGLAFSDTLDSNTTLVTGTVQTNRGAVTSGNGAGDTSAVVNVGTLPGGGASADISYRVTINDPLPAGVTQVANQGLVSSNELPPEPTDDPDTIPEDDETVTPVTAAPVLEAEKTDTLFNDADGDGVPSPGDTLLYQIHIVNSGNIAATGVILTDTLDPNTTLVTGTVQTNRGSVTSGNGAGDTSVAVNVGTLPGGGASADISYRVTINYPLPASVTQIANQGLVSSNELPVEPTDDPDTGPEDDETVTPVTAAPVLEAEKTDTLFNDADGDGVPSPGDTLLYQVSIVNSGNIAATGLVFSDTLDPNTTLVTGTVQTNRGAVTSGNGAGDVSVSVDVGTLPGGGASANISYQAIIHAPLPAGVTRVANQGLVTSNELPPEPTDDPDTPEDDDETRTVIVSAPEVNTYKTDFLFDDVDGDGIASPGDTLLYEVTLVNNGGAVALGVIFSDTVDANTTLVVGSVQASAGTVISGNNAGDSRVVVSIVAIPGGGGTVNISFRVVIADPLPEGTRQVANQGEMSGSNFESEPTDDPDTPEDDDETLTPVILCPIPPDAYEPDNLYPQAVEIPTNGTVQTRTFHMVADKDWVRFHALAGGIYTITTSHLPADVDTVLQLYDTDGVTLLDENDDYMSGSKASRIVWSASTSGWYFVRVTHFDPTYDPRYSLICGNYYQIAVEETTSCPTSADIYEPNNLYPQAVEIPTDGTVQTHTFHMVADKDWVRFFAVAHKVYTITTSHLPADVDTVLQLYDTDGVTLLDENDDYMPGSKASRIVWTAPTSGWYFARINHFDHTYDPRYSLVCGNTYQVAVETNACVIAPDTYEPDNLYPLAIWAPVDGTVLARTFHRVADKDWIRFHALAGKVYTITTSQLSADIDTVLQLYDTDGVTLLDENDDYMLDSEASRIVWRAPADGWYFARTTHFDPTYDPRISPICGGQYLIAVETNACITPPDAYEMDNFYSVAAEIPTDGTIQTHTLHTAADKDWLTFYAWGRQVYSITTFQLSPDVDTVLRVYDMDGVTLLTENDDHVDGSKASGVEWKAPADGWYFIRITHFDSSYNPRLSTFCGNQYHVAIKQQILDANKIAEFEDIAPKAGDEILYTIIITNLMQTAQTNIVITDTIPNYTTYVTGSAQVSQGSVYGPDPLVVKIGTLQPYQTATLTFRVIVDYAERGYAITNVALVNSDQQGIPIRTPFTTVPVYHYLYIPMVIRDPE